MERRIVLRIASYFAALGLLLLPFAARAQSTSSFISGIVLDQAGNPLRGVRVVANSPTQIGGDKTSYTDGDGAFRIPGLSPGIFTVTASAAGLTSVVQKNIELSVNAPVELTFVLEVQTTTESVTVIEKPPVLSVTAANVKETFTQEFIEKVPLVAPSFHHMADQAVGWNATGTQRGGGNFRVRGGNVYDNNITVDGFLMADPVTRQTAQFVNFDAVAAVEVQSAAYGAENAQAQGGVLNVVTKTGSNEFHFDTQAVYTDNNLNFWREPIDRNVPTRNVWFNLGVGGPVLKDKLWFYVSGEINSIVANQGADPSGRFEQLRPSSDFLATRFLGKLTWQATERNKLSLLTIVAPDRIENARQSFDYDSSAERFDKAGNQFYGLTWQSLMTDNLFFRLQGAYNQINRTSEPQNCIDNPKCLDVAQRRELDRNVRLNSFERAEESIGRNYQVNSDLEWFKDNFFGDHRFKIGFRANFNENPFSVRIPGDAVEQVRGVVNPVNERLTTYCLNDPSTGDCEKGWLSTKVTGQNHLAFFQDAWKPTQHLTITAGVALNYGRQNDPDGNKVIDIMAPTPHISTVWDATRDGKTALRGSFAGYVDTGFLELARYAAPSHYTQECRWDPVTNAYTASCSFGGGPNRNTIGKPCGETGVDSFGAPCDDTIRTPRTWEYTVGAERQIFEGTALGGDFIYRRYVNQWEDAEVNRVWNRGGTALRSDGGYKNGRSEQIFDLSPREESNRRYRGLTVFIRRYEGKFQALLAWTRHRQWGAPLTFNSNYLTNPAQTDFLYGDLSTDQRNEAKFMGSYRFTNWLTLGTNVIYRNGPPWSRRYYNTVTGSYSDLRSPTGTNPRNENDADDDFPIRENDALLAYAQVRVNWKPLIGQSLETWVDVFNIAGNRELQSFVQDDGPLWGVPASRRAPPSFKFGLRYRY